MNIGSAAENDFVANLDPGEDLWIGLVMTRPRKVKVIKGYIATRRALFVWINTRKVAQYKNFHPGKRHTRQTNSFVLLISLLIYLVEVVICVDNLTTNSSNFY